ncbi:MAG: hypothetical protein IPG45_18790 [Deltaproteobacteria bacterium]|jgi:hypothetical protein|nr:hypothetical protein [Deltaproteobacteria bacterium]
MRKLTCTLLFAVVSAPGLASAYSDTMSFARDPSADTAGGGGGLYFTGSPRQHGLDCAACHVEPSGEVGLRLSALLDGEEVSLFKNGYQLGRTYEIEVAFDGDLLTPQAPCGAENTEVCDLNLFALEILDERGQGGGTFCPTAPRSGPASGCGACPTLRARGTLAEADCSVIVSDGFDPGAGQWRNGVTAYSFFWTAPTDDVGPVMLYVSAVDGHGQESEGGELTSQRHDAVVTVQAPIRSPSRDFQDPSSCHALGREPPWPIALLALVVGRRRRTR